MVHYQRDEESHSLLNHEGRQNTQPQEKKSGFNYVRAIAVLTATVVGVVMITQIAGKPHTSSLTASLIKENKPMASKANVNIQIKVRTADYDEPKSLENLPWDAVAEPFKKNKLTLKSFDVDGKAVNLASNADKLQLKWTIDGKNFDGMSEVQFQVDRTGLVDASVTITAKEAVGTIPAGTVFTQDFKLASKYIRREIRTLTDADREAFFSALKQVYTVEESVGQALYGEKFHSAEYFLVKHLHGAATSDCDHWHDGAGIVTHHTAITLAMEQSLQAINPTVAMPYWEYGMDAYLYDSFAESPIFNANWYGEASPSNDDHKIADGGIWQDVQFPSGSKYLEWDISKTGSLRPYVNAYGQLRSPWNNNPSLAIGRHNQVYDKTSYTTAPSCSLFKTCFQNTQLSDIFSCLNGKTHGPVHIMIGGAWNEGNTLDDVKVKIFQNPDKLLLFKVLWRMGLTRCPESCAPNEECKCAVPDLYLKQYGAKGVLQMAGILDAFDSNFHDADDVTLLKVIRALEDPGIVGDMYSSAASYDPTFWPLHGSAERLVSYKRALVSSGVIKNFDETWDYPSFTSSTLTAGAYLDGKCDWSKVKGPSDLTLPTCTMGSWCSGHFATDVLEFGNFMSKGESYTNAQMYSFIHPWNEDLPYTYDTYDYDYCTDNGYDFLDNLTSKAPPKTAAEKAMDQALKGGYTTGM